MIRTNVPHIFLPILLFSFLINYSAEANWKPAKDGDKIILNEKNIKIYGSTIADYEKNSSIKFENNKIFIDKYNIPEDLITLHYWSTTSHDLYKKIKNWDWMNKNSHTLFGKIMLKLHKLYAS